MWVRAPPRTPILVLFEFGPQDHIALEQFNCLLSGATSLVGAFTLLVTVGLKLTINLELEMSTYAIVTVGLALLGSV